MQYLEYKNYFIKFSRNYFFSKFFFLKSKIVLLKKLNIFFIPIASTKNLIKKIMFLVSICLLSKYPIFLKKSYFDLKTINFIGLKLEISSFICYLISLMYLPVLQNLNLMQLNKTNNFFTFKLIEIPFIEQFSILNVFNLIFNFLNYIKFFLNFKLKISNWYMNETIIRSFFFLVVITKRKKYLITKKLYFI